MKKKNSIMTGLSWSFIDLLSRQGLTFIIHIVLARILIPSDFGLIGMIAIFIAVSLSLVNSGMDQALIREKTLNDKDYSTVFIFNMAISLILYGLIFLSAKSIATFYSTPEIELILKVLMLIIFLNALSLVPRVELIRNLEFKKQSLISLVANIISGIISISMAFAGFGVWSLVAQQLTMKFAETLLLLFSSNIKPQLIFSYESFRKFFSFGFRLMISGLINNIYNNIYLVIIGKLYSVNVLGYYTNANKIKDSLTLSLTGTIQKVTYPILSQQQDQPEKLVENYTKLISVTTFIMFPIIMGISAISPDLIVLLLGHKWENSIIYFQLLCLMGMSYPIQALNLNILKVKNRSDLFLKIELQKKGITTLFIIIALLSETGVLGLIYAAICGGITSSVINMIYTQKVIDYSFSSQIKDITMPLLISILMFLSVTQIREILNFPVSISLLLQITTGIGVYILLSYLFKIKQVFIVSFWLKRLISRKS